MNKLAYQLGYKFAEQAMATPYDQLMDQYNNSDNRGVVINDSEVMNRLTDKAEMQDLIDSIKRQREMGLDVIPVDDPRYDVFGSDPFGNYYGKDAKGDVFRMDHESPEDQAWGKMDINSIRKDAAPDDLPRL